MLSVQKTENWNMAKYFELCNNLCNGKKKKCSTITIPLPVSVSVLFSMNLLSILEVVISL